MRAGGEKHMVGVRALQPGDGGGEGCLAQGQGVRAVWRGGRGVRAVRWGEGCTAEWGQGVRAVGWAEGGSEGGLICK